MKRGKKASSEEAYIKLWRLEQLDELPPAVPAAVKSRAKEIMETLNRHYGEDRDVDRDLGGHVALFPEPCQKKDHEAFLELWRLTESLRESMEVICRSGEFLWVAELYLCGSDYGVVIVRTDPLEEKENERRHKKQGKKGGE